MATAKERIQQLLDELPDSEAEEIERLLLAVKASSDEARWRELAATAFGSWFTAAEYDYPDEPGAPS